MHLLITITKQECIQRTDEHKVSEFDFAFFYFIHQIKGIYSAFYYHHKNIIFMEIRFMEIENSLLKK